MDVKDIPAALKVRVQFPVAHSRSLTAEIDVSCLHAGTFPERKKIVINMYIHTLHIQLFYSKLSSFTQQS